MDAIELLNISLIPIGYPAESPKKSKRLLSGVMHWEKY
jgi:hypothetical protein